MDSQAGCAGPAFWPSHEVSRTEAYLSIDKTRGTPYHVFYRKVMKATLQKLFQTLSVRFPAIPFAVRYWDGEIQAFGEGSPVFTIGFNAESGAKAVFRSGAMGFREHYVEGTIDVEGDLEQLLRLGMDPSVQNMKLSIGTKIAVLLQHLRSLNTIRRSPTNIARHYDLGNDFYRQYLDESMTYSCAYFRNEGDSLEQAQRQKYEHICRKLRLKEGESLVDIGCGWGGMLVYAARRYGVTGVGCTLSENQAAYAQERIAQEGLEKSVTVLRKDYRNLDGQFDKFVSIGMFEHVGKRFIPGFMRKAKSLLREGGIGLLHSIGKERATPLDPWTMKHIFPGGHIPALGHIMDVMGQERLVPVDVENLRLHYAATLDEWGKRFETHAETIEKMFDPRLVRMWRMYLMGCVAAFRWGDIRLYQILFTNGLNNTLPLTREHLYAD
jgi:cyclopropane-fatty-acyl-phospholipid synthase